MKPRPLPANFNRHGHTYTLIKRRGEAAFYDVQDVGTSALLGHEVIRIRIAKESKLPGGKIAPVREVYPGDEEFGRNGWYFAKTDGNRAQQKYLDVAHGKADQPA